MLQGTGSNVGKSLLVAGLARAYADRGVAVRPFKPQNMSNNAAVTVDGGEIGRAQALQARAARIPASVHMNPVLLKPQTDIGAQVVVQGQVEGNADARGYHALKPRLLPRVLDSFARLGALVADVDRGGALAAVVGTCALLEDAERALLKGYIINKFRGDPALFDDAQGIITGRTGLESLGVVPHLSAARRLPAEDGVVLDNATVAAPRAAGAIHIAVPRLPRIANFDDLDPLIAEADVTVTMVEPGAALPGDADMVLIPGSKSTLGDLAALRAEGWDIDIQAHVRRGGWVLGLCGGYQMLGTRISDPQGIEGPAGEAEGLGLLDIETMLEPEKHLAEVAGTEVTSGAALHGYEMHMGVSTGPDLARPMIDLGDRHDGARSADGRVLGCYFHGLFVDDDFRHGFLARLATRGASGVARPVAGRCSAGQRHGVRCVESRPAGREGGGREGCCREGHPVAGREGCCRQGRCAEGCRRIQKSR